MSKSSSNNNVERVYDVEHIARVLGLIDERSGVSSLNKDTPRLDVLARMAGMVPQVFGSIQSTDPKTKLLREIASRFLKERVDGSSGFSGFRDWSKKLNKIERYFGEGDEYGPLRGTIYGVITISLVCKFATAFGALFCLPFAMAIPLAVDSMYIDKRFYDDSWLLLLNHYFGTDFSSLEGISILHSKAEAEKVIQDAEKGIQLSSGYFSQANLQSIRTRKRVKAVAGFGGFMLAFALVMSNPIILTAGPVCLLYVLAGYLAASEAVDRCTKHQSLAGMVGSLFCCNKSDASPSSQGAFSESASPETALVTKQ